MQSYSSDEKEFLKIIATKAVEPKAFFQLLVSEEYFKKDYRPFMLVDSQEKRILFFFGEGEKHKEFPRFINFIALMEDLVADRLIVRVPMSQGTYFVGEFYDAQEVTISNGNIRYISGSTGRYIETPNIQTLHNSSGSIIASLDVVVFDDPDHFERFSRAFSGLVYPREALKELVKHKFRSVDQRRHRHTMAAAWIAILLSLILSSFSLYSNCENECFEAARDWLNENFGRE